MRPIVPPFRTGRTPWSTRLACVSYSPVRRRAQGSPLRRSDPRRGTTPVDLAEHLIAGQVLALAVTERTSVRSLSPLGPSYLSEPQCSLAHGDSASALNRLMESQLVCAAPLGSAVLHASLEGTTLTNGITYDTVISARCSMSPGHEHVEKGKEISTFYYK